MTDDGLPAVVEGEIIDGEIVDDDGPGPEPPARHQAAMTAARHIVWIGLGFAVLVRRTWDSRSDAGYNRWIRSAEADGDHARLLEFEARRAAHRKDRHQRRMDWIQVPAHAAKGAFWVIGALLAGLTLIGLALVIARHSFAAVTDPFVTFAAVVTFLVGAVSAGWLPFLVTVSAAFLLLFWRAGRRHALTMTTGWLAAGRPQDDVHAEVTCDTIALALAHLTCAALQRALKEGWRPEFHLLPVKEPHGYTAVFSLPLGVTPQMIADQRPVLARNLHRAEVEVWPSDAEKGGAGPPGTVALWVADRGALSRPAPEYPLLHSGTADVFEGVPAGVSPRGDAIVLPVTSNNFVAGGQMGQGKSNACRVTMLGAALDPIAELWIHVLAFNGDFDAYEPRLARYVRGAEDEHIAAAVASLEELYAEVARREAKLAELGAKKVTRGLALQHADLRPRLALFSECHEMFGHPEFGKQAAEVAAAVLRRARKTAIWTGFDTQSSRKDAIPPKVVELVSVNACFYVKSWRSNDGFLGDGSFAAGIRATELRPGRDRGTSLITGVSDAQFELLRWYFIAVDDDTGYDAAAEVIDRAVARAAPGVITAAQPVAAIEDRDLLADVTEVCGTEKVRLADLPARLRELAPRHPAYRGLTGVQLRALLEDRGVRVTNAGNVPRLDPADLLLALPERGE